MPISKRTFGAVVKADAPPRSKQKSSHDCESFFDWSGR